jgi:hypothetical protein
MIDRITTYHWNDGRGAAPGTIALRAEDGRVFGPWPAEGSEGMGGVPDAYWTVRPGVVLPAGRYTIIDSSPATWATNEDVGNRGIFTLEIRQVVPGQPQQGARETGQQDRASSEDSAADSAENIFWQSIAASDDPADFEAYLRAYPDGLFAPLARNRLDRLARQSETVSGPSPSSTSYYTPARGTAERSALMDAARGPIQRELGQPVIFVVSRLRSDGNWAYLAATPVQPDGTPLDWSRTPLADEWAADMMSDLVLVVMRRGAEGWQTVEYVIGPTDVAWVNWRERYGWPRALFAD